MSNPLGSGRAMAKGADHAAPRGAGGGDGGRRSPELLTAQLYTRFFWFRLSQCHRGVLSRTLNTNWEEKLSITIRKTGRCHTPTWRRVQNAVCLNGVGHDGDSPNDASYDVSNHTFRTLMLAGRSSQNENSARVWQSKREVARGNPHGGWVVSVREFHEENTLGTLNIPHGTSGTSSPADS